MMPSDGTVDTQLLGDEWAVEKQAGECQVVGERQPTPTGVYSSLTIIVGIREKSRTRTTKAFNNDQHLELDLLILFMATFVVAVLEVMAVRTT